mmetsp:Transcript_13901/g.43773  ORF Transcript_13901/g.43773 Transcript_13901/m.43773 type:complete len:211 (-) Transcript_13901:102-734(-)
MFVHDLGRVPPCLGPRYESSVPRLENNGRVGQRICVQIKEGVQGSQNAVVSGVVDLGDKVVVVHAKVPLGAVRHQGVCKVDSSERAVVVEPFAKGRVEGRNTLLILGVPGKATVTVKPAVGQREGLALVEPGLGQVDPLQERNKHPLSGNLRSVKLALNSIQDTVHIVATAVQPKPIQKSIFSLGACRAFDDATSAGTARLKPSSDSRSC